MALFKRNETGPSVAEALSLWGDATPTPLPLLGRNKGEGVGAAGGEAYLGEPESTCVSKGS